MNKASLRIFLYISIFSSLITLYSCSKSNEVISGQPTLAEISNSTSQNSVTISFYVNPDSSYLLNYGNISIYFDNVYIGSLTHIPYVYSPSCGDTYTINKIVSRSFANHTWYAQNNNFYWGTSSNQRTISISSTTPSCVPKMLE
jgi:hypothetical protein